MKMSLKLILTSCIVLGGCSSVTLAPNKMGAENDCSRYSANLSQYNECMARVEAEFRAYEQERRLSEKGG